MNKLFKTISAGVVATGLLATILPVASTFAASSDSSNNNTSFHDRNHNVHRSGTYGTITSMALNSDGSGTLQLTVKKPNADGDQGVAAQNGQTLTVSFKKEVKLSLRNKKDAVFNDILVGDNVVVQGTMASDGTNVYNATSIHDVSAFVTGKRSFTVTAIDSANHTLTATVTTKHGDTKTVKVIYSSSTVFKLNSTTTNSSALYVGATIKVKGINHIDSSGNATVFDVQSIVIKSATM